MSSAAERAAEVLLAAYVDWLHQDPHSGLPPEPSQVAALMSDPDLLVDLAIQAGGLVETGGSRQPGTYSLYRRKEATNG